tara:strand:- start:431 stop:1177 length:747 start_codon:yes stop_codon:yes gene_type:complete
MEANGKTDNEINILDKLYIKKTNHNIPVDKSWNELLFLPRQNLSMIIAIDYIYKKIINSVGNIFEFGCRFGAKTSLFYNLKKIYQPYNYNRKLIIFDTFDGFPSVDEKDKNDMNQEWVKEKNYNVTENYEDELDEIMNLHEKNAPISHIKQYEIVKGDVTKTLPNWLDDNKHSIASLVYFDMDIYKPTKDSLNNILKICHKGSILCFDEINEKNWPGETLAILEELNVLNYKIEVNPYACNMGIITLQ